MFVRERDLTSIVEKAHDELAAHRQFMAWRDAATETELRCTSWLGDDRRRADLNVFQAKPRMGVHGSGAFLLLDFH